MIAFHRLYIQKKSRVRSRLWCGVICSGDLRPCYADGDRKQWKWNQIMYRLCLGTTCWRSDDKDGDVAAESVRKVSAQWTLWTERGLGSWRGFTSVLTVSGQHRYLCMVVSPLNENARELGSVSATQSKLTFCSRQLFVFFHSVLPVLSLPYWSFQLYISLYESLLQPWYNR